jgi:hypothetical protein
MQRWSFQKRCHQFMDVTESHAETESDLETETAGNYYHLSPHIRAHVLCAPPRARYVFLTPHKIAAPQTWQHADCTQLPPMAMSL